MKPVVEKIVALFMCLAGVLGARNSFAGVSNGGGGKVVVCRDAQGEISSATLLDLYEGELLYGYKLASLSGSSNEIVKRVASRYARLTAAPGESVVDKTRLFDSVQSAIKFLPLTTSLRDLDDVSEVLIPKTCKLEQLARYQADNLILVDSEIWSHLDEVNRAALIVHEAVYKITRDIGDHDSVYARKLVGALFSDLPLVPVYDGLPSKYMRCYEPSERFLFVVYPVCLDGHCKTRIQFSTLNFEPVLTKSTVDADFNYDDLDDWAHPIKSIIDFKLDLETLLSSGEVISGSVGPASKKWIRADGKNVGNIFLLGSTTANYLNPRTTLIYCTYFGY